MGPWIATGIEPRDMTTHVRLNGETVHRFRPATCCSAPAKSSATSRAPTRCRPATWSGSAPTKCRRALEPGDTIEIEITGIGVLRNPVVAGNMKRAQMTRAGLATLAAAPLALMVATLSPALAQKYPSRPIRVMLPFAAGSVSDVTLRILADKLGARLGTSIIVENQPRAGGTTAALAAKTATAGRLYAGHVFELDRDQRLAAEGPALRSGRRFPADLGHQHLRQHHRGQLRLEVPHARPTCWQPRAKSPAC